MTLDAQLQARAQAFNAQFPVGTEVIRFRLVNPLRDPVRSVVRSEAWVMGGHTVMVQVAGIAGGVMIESIQAVVDVGGRKDMPGIKGTWK